MNIITERKPGLNFPLTTNSHKLPHLFALTDSNRGPNPIDLIDRLPKTAGLIFRHYDMPNRHHLAKSVIRACQKRDILCFIAGDIKLSAHLKADGVHLPEHQLRRPNYGLSHFKQAGGLVTAATHSLAAGLLAQKQGVDGVFLSPVFPTKSHVGAPHIGLIRFARVARNLKIPVFALGGIDVLQKPLLKNAGAYGLGGISLFE